MAGGVEQGRKAAVTNIKRFGADYYSRIGRAGGKASHKGGFYANRELASRAGRLGGLKSRRGKAVPSLSEVKKYNTVKRNLLQKIGDKLHGSNR